MNSRFQGYRQVVRQVGLVPAIFNKFQRMRLSRLPPTRTVRMRSKYSRFDLLCRAGSSDIRVFDQIFQVREY